MVLLYPNKEGKTALEIAVDEKRPKSLDLMIDLLKNFNNTMISKSMLKVFPRLIYKTNDTVLDFFDNLIYSPPLLDTHFVVAWPSDLDEFIFCNNCSILSSKSIEDKLQEENKISKDKKNELKKKLRNKNR